MHQPSMSDSLQIDVTLSQAVVGPWVDIQRAAALTINEAHGPARGSIDLDRYLGDIHAAILKVRQHRSPIGIIAHRANDAGADSPLRQGTTGVGCRPTRGHSDTLDEGLTVEEYGRYSIEDIAIEGAKANDLSSHNPYPSAAA